ncbi:hypothetical protein [Caulobacter mirabilis]|nr:hypothetical protein [Caulobacter mirabilis]
MNVSKMDHAMLSFGLMGGLLVPRPTPPKGRGLFGFLRVLNPFRKR